MAAVLACGEGAALSHASGAALYGMLDEDPGPPHVTVPTGRHPQHPGIRVHRRRQMLEVVRRENIPAVSPLAVLLDLAPSRSFEALDRLVNATDKIGLLDPEAALDQLATLPGRRGLRKLHHVLSTHRVTDSGLERRFLALVDDAGLRPPDTQITLCGFRVDFVWPELGLVVETDGLTYHRTASQQARDRVRDQRLTAAGYTCLRFTNAQVRRDPRSVVATLRAVAERLRARTVHLSR
jgi:very-short-patch-repair endonuclease